MARAAKPKAAETTDITRALNATSDLVERHLAGVDTLGFLPNVDMESDLLYELRLFVADVRLHVERAVESLGNGDGNALIDLELIQQAADRAVLMFKQHEYAKQAAERRA